MSARQDLARAVPALALPSGPVRADDRVLERERGAATVFPRDSSFSTEKESWLFTKLMNLY